MRRLTVFLVALAISLPTSYLHARKKPVTVIITAGQSNTDGRVSNDDLPSYIKENGYSYCKWSYGSDTLSGGGRFTPFWPRVFKQDNTNKWGYDAIVYYLIEKSLRSDFYVIKESLGGTAIDTACVSTSGMYWNASPEYLAANAAADIEISYGTREKATRKWLIFIMTT